MGKTNCEKLVNLNLLFTKDEKGVNEFLLLELQNGQERAFDFVFRKYYKSLCAQANVYVKDLDTAQSLVQACFVKLWENRNELDKVSNLVSYLSLMVRNKCFDYLRKKKFIEFQTDTDLPVEVDGSGESEVSGFEFEECVVLAVASLPQRCRIAFEYSRFEGFSYKEIAEKMDITVKAVERLISRALKILRKELKPFLNLIVFSFMFL